MRKTVLLILSALFLFGGNIFAQVVEDNESNEEFDQFYERPIVNKAKKPFVYPYVRASDVVWEKVVWRTIDFREKMNQVFYYPLEPQQSRMNMYTMIDNALTEGSIKAYSDDEFKNEVANWDTLKNAYSKKRMETIYDEPDIDGMEQYHEEEVISPMKPMDIMSIRLKERWFIDKQRSVRDVRIVGFCFIYNNEVSEGNIVPTPIMWIRFNDPEVRDLLANTEVYNPKNDAERRTYDDVFQKRMFSSYVIRESNTPNRSISDYLTGMDALYESERVEEFLFDMEQDMWEY